MNKPHCFSENVIEICQVSVAKSQYKILFDMCPLTHDRDNYFDRGHFKKEGSKEQGMEKDEKKEGS